MTAFDTPSVTADDDELQKVREALFREHGTGYAFQTRYLFASPPLWPVAAIAVGNNHDWAAYIAGVPFLTSIPAVVWLEIYRQGAKLPRDVAEAWFRDFGTGRRYRE